MSENTSSIEYSLNYIGGGNSSYKNSLSIIASFVGFFSIIPVLALMGYMFDIREASYNDEPIPEFENYERLVKEGYNGFIAYTPLLFLLFLTVLLTAIYPPFMFTTSGLVIVLWPAVSMKYAIERDYKEIYGSGVLSIVTNESYIKNFIIYALFLIVMISTLSVASLISFGLGLVVGLPVLIISKCAFWGYVLRDYEV